MDRLAVHLGVEPEKQLVGAKRRIADGERELVFGKRDVLKTAIDDIGVGIELLRYAGGQVVILDAKHV